MYCELDYCGLRLRCEGVYNKQSRAFRRNTRWSRGNTAEDVSPPRSTLHQTRIVRQSIPVFAWVKQRIGHQASCCWTSLTTPEHTSDLVWNCCAKSTEFCRYLFVHISTVWGRNGRSVKPSDLQSMQVQGSMTRSWTQTLSIYSLPATAGNMNFHAWSYLCPVRGTGWPGRVVYKSYRVHSSVASHCQFFTAVILGRILLKD